MAGLNYVPFPWAFLVTRKSLLVVSLWDRYCYKHHCQGDQFSLIFRWVVVVCLLSVKWDPPWEVKIWTCWWFLICRGYNQFHLEWQPHFLCLVLGWQCFCFSLAPLRYTILHIPYYMQSICANLTYMWVNVEWVRNWGPIFCQHMSIMIFEFSPTRSG